MCLYPRKKRTDHKGLWWTSQHEGNRAHFWGFAPNFSQLVKKKRLNYQNWNKLYKAGQACLELDELWSHMGNKKNKVWTSIALDRSTRQIVSYAVENRSSYCRGSLAKHTRALPSSTLVIQILGRLITKLYLRICIKQLAKKLEKPPILSVGTIPYANICLLIGSCGNCLFRWEAASASCSNPHLYRINSGSVREAFLLSSKKS